MTNEEEILFDEEGKKLSPESKLERIDIQAIFVSIGALIFIITALLEVVDLVLFADMERVSILGYIITGLLLIGYISIGYGIRKLAILYFIDHTTKMGKETSLIFVILGSASLINLVFLEWPGISIMVWVLLVVGRIIAFLKLHQFMEKVKFLFQIKIGGILYLLFAFYSLLFTVFSTFTFIAGDLEIYNFVNALNIYVKPLLAGAVGIKIIIDIIRIRKWIKDHNVKPHSIERSWMVRYDKDVTDGIDNSVSSILAQKIEHMDKETIEREREALKLLQEPKRTISVTKERALKEAIILISVISFFIYGFIAESFMVTLMSIIFISGYVTYIVVQFIIVVYLGHGVSVANFISDFFYYLVLFPVFTGVLSFGMAFAIMAIFNVKSRTTGRIILGTLWVATYLVILFLDIKRNMAEEGLTFIEYIKWYFNFKERSKMKKRQRKIAQKKKARFDNLDQIQENIDKKRAAKAIDYNAFDAKLRMRELGSGSLEKSRKNISTKEEDKKNG